jgi:hypothetical protein
MKKIARTLRSHRELLLNHFKARKQISSGVLEGQSKSDHEKIVWLSYISHPGTRALTHLANDLSRSYP